MLYRCFLQEKVNLLKKINKFHHPHWFRINRFCWNIMTGCRTVEIFYTFNLVLICFQL